MNRILLGNSEIFPSKVVCIGRNYIDHINELNNEIPEEMVFFIKPNSAISHSLVFPKGQSSCHYEAEISFLTVLVFVSYFLQVISMAPKALNEQFSNILFLK